MVKGNWFDFDGKRVGENLEFGTNDLEFAKFQAMAVTGLGVLLEAHYFVVLGDDKRRLVIGVE